MKDPVSGRWVEMRSLVRAGEAVLKKFPMFSCGRPPCRWNLPRLQQVPAEDLGVHPVVDRAGADIDTLNHGLVTVPSTVDGLAVSDVDRIV